MAWFFKMTGDADLAEQQKPAFVAFLKSVKFTTAPAQAELPPSHPPIGDMGMGAPAAAAGPISSEGKPNWQVPAGWQEVSGGQFLVAKFMLTGAEWRHRGRQCQQFHRRRRRPGGNVNRWRGQLGLAPLSDDDVNKLVTTIDVAGRQGIARGHERHGRPHRPADPARGRDCPAVRPDLVLQTHGRCEGGGKPEGRVHQVCSRREILKLK